MLISNTAMVTWNSRNKKHYVERGYSYSKMGDSFEVDVNDLTPGSQSVVQLRCDYCGRDYNIQWVTYNGILRKEVIRADACKKCCELKSRDAIHSRYGSFSGMFAASNEKRQRTNLDKYGACNPFANEGVKAKIVQTNMSKYGVPYSQQNDIVRSKTRSTCSERYGVENYVELFRGKFIGEDSPVWKGGPKESGVERASRDYIVWRKSVFDRDKYTCKCCGARNGNGHTVVLNAHHIFNWADNEPLRYSTDNGITLCERCHVEFHRLYGKRNNNDTQLYEFINKRLDKKIC